MIRRTMDATFLNRVANDPAVRPYVGGHGTLDLSPILALADNVVVENEFGGFVGVKIAPAVYECHSLFLPEGRGPKAVTACQQALRYLFVQTDCMEVVTKCPHENRASLGLARRMGFIHQFQCEKSWPSVSGELTGCDYLSLSFAKWCQMDTEVESGGKWFHQRLEELTSSASKPLPEHFEEAAHNRAVGASVLMFRAGNPIKAANTYNQWARFAGYPVITLKSVNPVIIDMDQVVVSLNDNDLSVLLCR